MTNDRVEQIDDETCRALLAGNHFGRVAVTDEQGPVVLPVNYALMDGDVVFRSDPGTKVETSERGAAVSFEIDDVDERTRTGWSVLVRGTIREVVDEDELGRLRELPLDPFAGGEKDHYLRVTDGTISGRRIDIPEGVPDEWFRPTGLGHVWRDRDAADLGL